MKCRERKSKEVKEREKERERERVCVCVRERERHCFIREIKPVLCASASWSEAGEETREIL